MKISPIYYLIAIVIFLLTQKKHKNLMMSLLLTYCFLVYSTTVLARASRETIEYNFTPFRLFLRAKWWESQDYISQLLANVFLFIPIGFLSSCFKRKGMMIVGVLFSCFIEISQFWMRRGLCEVDDIICNSVGLLAGAGAFRLIRWRISKARKMKAYEGIYNRYIKRIIGLVIAIPFFVVALPLYLVIGISILAEDGRPVFYRPLRGGYKGRPFRIFKFRTMVKNADKIGGGTTANHDPRITKVGAVLRKTKLDETANLINIILGTMSFIGPRPELLQYTEQYTGDEKSILEVRPGVTDYSSIEFINLDEIVGTENADLMYEKYVLKKKNRLRVKYAENVSLATDASIFLTTVIKVLEKIFGFVFENKHR